MGSLLPELDLGSERDRRGVSVCGGVGGGNTYAALLCLKKATQVCTPASVSQRL